MGNSSRRERIDPIWWAPVLLLIIVGLIALTALLFSGALRAQVPLTLVSDRAGLVMEPGAKVKFRGVQIGEVGSIGAQSAAEGTQARLALKIDPGPFRYLPANLEAEIKSSTAFGAKYVDLIVPDDGASTQTLKRNSVLHSRNVTVEVNTVFQQLRNVLDKIDPVKLNLTLAAAADVAQTLVDERALETPDPFSRTDGWCTNSTWVRPFAFEYQGESLRASLA